MIGMEPSKEMLNLARQSACGQQVKWIKGDALKLIEFKADMAIMTGHVAQFYVDDEYWYSALKYIHKAIRHGGYFVFESRNPDVQPWTNNPAHIDWPSQTSPRKVIDPVVGEIKWWMHLLQVRGERVLYENHYLFTNSGEELISVNELRFRTREEITQSLINAGFSVDTVYGNWDSSLASQESLEFIFIAKKIK